ncbi:hypothetical protein WJX74_009452 [Apatococcus lobatus]|uniref:F-box domain-containing protein n=1 Tax=Apatococcus lobatus TaxID=904363 RepID=A0AAW1QMF7_9CHLO
MPPSSFTPAPTVPSGHPIEQLTEPFWQLVLPRLPAASIIALSHASSFLHRLVANAPCISPSNLRTFEGEALPRGVQGQAKGWQHLQRMLRSYSHALAEMRASRRGQLQVLPMRADQQATDMVWATTWPSHTLVIPSATIRVDGLDGHKDRNLFGPWAQPYIVSPSTMQPTTSHASTQTRAMFWAVWCHDAVHFVAFIEDATRSTYGYDEEGFSIAVCKADGAIVTKVPCHETHGWQVATDGHCKRIVSPARDAVLVPSNEHDESLHLCSLPDLQLQRLFICPLHHSAQFDNRLGALTWAPDGQHFAALWHGPCGEDGLLCIYAASEGRLVGSLQLEAYVPYGSYSVCEWCPTSTCLLLCGYKHPEEEPPSRDPYHLEIVHLDGSTQAPAMSEFGVCFEVSTRWSGCERFLSIVYLIDDRL